MIGRRLLPWDTLHSPYRSGRRTSKRKVKRADQRRAKLLVDEELASCYDDPMDETTKEPTLTRTEDGGLLLTSEHGQHYQPLHEEGWWDQHWRYTPDGTAQADPPLSMKLDAIAATLEEPPLPKVPVIDVDALQEAMGEELEAHWAGLLEDFPDLTPADVAPYPEGEFVYNHLSSSPGDFLYPVHLRAVREALDRPWKSGSSLRERYIGTGEECC